MNVNFRSWKPRFLIVAVICSIFTLFELFSGGWCYLSYDLLGQHYSIGFGVLVNRHGDLGFKKHDFETWIDIFMFIILILEILMMVLTLADILLKLDLPWMPLLSTLLALISSILLVLVVIWYAAKASSDYKAYTELTGISFSLGYSWYMVIINAVFMIIGAIFGFLMAREN